jgi:membrane protein DedA with SNARE-associated domain
MQDFLNQYGYLALIIGTFLEGEVAILIASSLVSNGIFQLHYTILFAFSGSFISDWLYYLIGRFNGKYFVERNETAKRWATPVTNLFNQYQLPVLLSYRFLYGFRIVIPVVIGMSGLRPLQFLVYSVVAGLLWASVVSITGYYIGSIFQIDAVSLQQNFLFVVLGFATFGAAIGFTVRLLVAKSLQP